MGKPVKKETAKGERPDSQIRLVRWSLRKAAPEFGINIATLGGRVRERGIIPGDDGLFSTQQILAAIFGSKEEEQIRNIQLDNEQRAVDLAKSKRELIPIQDAVRVWSSRVVAMKQAIVGSKLSDAEKRELLNHLAEIKEEEYGETTTEEEEEPET